MRTINALHICPRFGGTPGLPELQMYQAGRQSMLTETERDRLGAVLQVPVEPTGSPHCLPSRPEIEPA